MTFVESFCVSHLPIFRTIPIITFLASYWSQVNQILTDLNFDITGRTRQAFSSHSFEFDTFESVRPSVCRSGLEKILQPAARGGAASALKWPLRRAQRENMTKLLLKSTIFKGSRKMAASGGGETFSWPSAVHT